VILPAEEGDAPEIENNSEDENSEDTAEDNSEE
jgi:DNA gyrase subunit A